MHQRVADTPIPEGEGTIALSPDGGKLDRGPNAPHPLWDGIAQDARFYFVHSYYVQPQDERVVQGTSCYPAAFRVCSGAR